MWVGGGQYLSSEGLSLAFARMDSLHINPGEVGGALVWELFCKVVSST